MSRSSISIPIRDSRLPSPAGRMVSLQAGAVRLRHQARAPFHLHYNGERPILLFLFDPGSSRDSHPDRVCAKGSFTLLRPGSETVIENDDPIELLGIAYDQPIRVVEPAVVAEERCVVDPGARTIAHEIRRMLLREGEAGADYIESLAQTLLVRALHVLGGVKRLQPQAAITPFTIRRVMEMIDNRLEEHITVSDLAAVAGLSRAHFTRAFHGAVGESPHQYLLSRRLAYVRQRLEDGADDLALLAARAGFSSHAHMSTAFKQVFGVSPREHRELRLLGAGQIA
jgi:AraC family transcriptional regulator